MVEPTPINFAARLHALEERVGTPSLKGGDDDGTSGGMTDDWKKSVDDQLGRLHGDVRALLKVGTAAVVALAVLIGGLYLYTNTKFDAVQQSLANVQVQQEKLNGKIDTLLERAAKK